MPRKSKVDPAYEVDVLTDDNTIGLGYSSTPRQEVLDPLAPLSGAIKVVKEQRPPKRKKGELKAAKETYQMYVKNLIKYGGDEVMAIMDTLGMPQDEVEGRLAELKDALIANATSARSLSDVLKVYNVSKEARIAVLASHVYSNVPAASLKALDALNELDQGRIADSTSYEATIRKLLDRGR